MAQRILTAIATCSPSEELPGDLALRIADLETEGLYCLDSVVRTYALKKRANRMACCGRIQEARNLLQEVIRNYEGTGDRYNQAVATLDRARLLRVDFPEAAAADARAAKALAELIRQDRLAVHCEEFLLHAALEAENIDAVEGCLRNLLPAWLNLRRGLRNDADRVHFANEVAQEAEQCVRLFLRYGNVNRAFEVQEYCRAQALSDLLASSTPQVEEEAVSQETASTESPH
jgi:hypothetical protein